MKRTKHLFAVALFATSAPLWAESVPADTLRHYHVDEAVVVASPKETTSLRNQPISATLFNNEQLTALQVNSVKQLSVFAPNLFMPDYGSRITSAAYIRGVGSRMNTPAVGLYVDNVPYTDKSAYDFSFIDVERVDVLRGPQGTLYGRNTMGGLLHVHTADPLRHHGTKLSVGGTSHTDGIRAKGVTYLHPGHNLGLSVGAYYDRAEGFFDNTTTGGKADGHESFGGKLKAAWRISDAWRLDAALSYEYSDEDACPYFLTGQWRNDNGEQHFTPMNNAPSQNRQSTYRRGMLNTHLAATYTAPKFTFSSITAYQNLDDRLFMDQDFLSADIFSLTQQQRINAITQEFSIKSRSNARWRHTSGAFFMYQGIDTDCPVAFYGDGISFLNRQFAAVMPQQPPMSLSLLSPELYFTSDLSTPTVGAALFHQSTIALGAGLSATVGLRLDYDHRELDMRSTLAHPVDYLFSMPSMRIDANLSAHPELNGRLNDDSWQLLPKFALQYDHRSGRGNVYVAVSKGYRSGGYNIQAYSDLAQTLLRRDIMIGLKDYCVETINNNPYIPEAQKQGAIAGMTGMLTPHIPEEPQVATLAYKPEQSWNYELGGHLRFFGNRLNVDYTLYYMHTTNQQLARFAQSGLGRIMVNAGESRSLGAELMVRSQWMDNRLHLSAAYGYTNAQLKEHNLGTSGGTQVDYSGNRVPFAPEHTLGVEAAFRQPLQHKVFNAVFVGANTQAAGKIYWDEANTFSQPFYATLHARLGVEMLDGLTLELWGRNLTDSTYDTFSFESMNSRFAQRGVPRHFGFDVRWSF